MFAFILITILAVILFILFLRVSIQLVYENELAVVLKVLCFKYTLFPKRKKLNVKKFSAKGIRRKLEKDKKILNKKQVKEQNKKSNTGIVDTLKNAYEILSVLVSRLLKYLKIRVVRLDVVIATDDAAKTAIQYGLAVQTVQYLVTVLEQITNFKVKKNCGINVSCDFLTEKSKLDLNIVMSLRVWQAIVILIRSALIFLGGTKKNIKDN